MRPLSDRFGNIVRTLEATDRATALGTLPNADTYLAELGLLDSDTASRALALSTVNTYSSDGIDLLGILGPTVTLALERDVADPDGGGPVSRRVAMCRPMPWHPSMVHTRSGHCLAYANK